MQDVRDAKERAYQKIEEARMEKDQVEQAVRSRIENKRDAL